MSMAESSTVNSWLLSTTDAVTAENNVTMIESLFNSTYNNDTLFCGSTDQLTVHILTQVLYAFVCIVGLLGNTLVIYVVLRFSKMQTVTNWYIVNLAVADECFLIGIPFLIATMSLQLWPFGNVMCKVYMASTSVTQFTSSIFLTIMSADRYVAVCHPISAPKMRTPFISKVVSLIAWTASALLMMPIFIYANIMDDNDQAKSCNILWPEGENLSGQTAFTLYTFVLGFAIPVVLIFFFYIMVIRKLKTVGPKNKSKEKKKSHRKVTKLVLIVITVYILCWLPYWITQMALIYTPPKQCQSKLNIIIFLVAGCFSYSNSAMNPILYAFLSDNFKKSFVKACTCAAGKEVNATLHLENSVFPRRTQRGGSERAGRQSGKGSGGGLTSGTTTSGGGGGGKHSANSGDQFAETGPLVSKVEHSTTVLTSRSNITVTSTTATPVKNGVKINLTPTQL